jgi:hypothetical protein
MTTDVPGYGWVLIGFASFFLLIMVGLVGYVCCKAFCEGCQKNPGYREPSPEPVPPVVQHILASHDALRAVQRYDTGDYEGTSAPPPYSVVDIHAKSQLE